MGGVNLKHQQTQRNVVQHIVEPSSALNQILRENEALKAQNSQYQTAIQQLQSALAMEQQSNKGLGPFKQIIEKPIPSLTVTLKDPYMIGQLRAMMIKIWGPGGELDMEGAWVQTAVNHKLQLLLTEIIRFASDHFYQLPGRLKMAEGVVPHGTAGMAPVDNTSSD